VYKKKQQGKPRIGGMWQKSTKKGETIFSVSLNAEHLPEPDEQGRIRLTALVNNNKEQESHPDFNLVEPLPPSTGGGNSGGGFKGRPAPSKGVNFAKRLKAPVQQQQQEEESEDGDDSDEDGSVPF
jgi:hypothetical protein